MEIEKHQIPFLASHSTRSVCIKNQRHMVCEAKLANSHMNTVAVWWSRPIISSRLVPSKAENHIIYMDE